MLVKKLFNQYGLMGYLNSRIKKNLMIGERRGILP